MGAEQATPMARMTVDEYLAWAADRPGRYELVDGRVVAMSPQTVRHVEAKVSALMALRFARRALLAMSRLGLRLEPGLPLLGRSFELSQPLADCMFLAHAESRSDMLITADPHFARKVKASPHGKLILELSAWRP